MLELPDMKTLLNKVSGATLLGQIPAPHTPQTVSAYVCSLISVPLQNFYDQFFSDILQIHELMNGERPSGGDMAQVWDEALDEAVEAAVSNEMQKFFGHGFFGEHSIDTRLHEPVERTSQAGFWARRTAEAWCEQMGLDAFLSCFGIPAASLVGTAANPAKTVDGQPAMATLAQILDMVRFAAFDTILDAMPEIEEMADSDDGLALSAVMRTKFPDKSLVPVDAAMMLVRGVREQARVMGEGFNEKLFALSQTSMQPGAPVTVDSARQIDAALGKGTKGRRGRKGTTPARPDVQTVPQAAAPPASGPTSAPEAAAALPPLPSLAPIAPLGPIVPADPGKAIIDAINALKAHSGSSEREIAEVIGISRSALNNIANGKAQPDLTHAQAGGLRLLAEKHRDELTGAIVALGGQ